MCFASRDGWWCAATTVLRLYLEIAIRRILCLKLCGLFEPVTFKSGKIYVRLSSDFVQGIAERTGCKEDDEVIT